ncbi:hypothetical protein [Streptomyces sp. NPDC021212]|uniref:hypothetical protein n=1 Tax=Streptomyces sp. NPDC021212 TaxID=3365118 RepID=UPI00378A4BD7
MKHVRVISNIALATLTLLPLTGTASASESSKHSPLRAYQVTIAEHSKSWVTSKGKTDTPTKSTSAATHFFTPQDPDYRANSQYGHFTAQVKYGSSSIRFMWSHKLNRRTAATATDLMDEVATATQNGQRFGCHDTHPDIAANYLAHSSFKAKTAHYVLKSTDKFPMAGNRTRTIHTEFEFTITLI